MFSIHYLKKIMASVHKIIVIVGFISLFHSAFSAAQRKYFRIFANKWIFATRSTIKWTFCFRPFILTNNFARVYGASIRRKYNSVRRILRVFKSTYPFLSPISIRMIVLSTFGRHARVYSKFPFSIISFKVGIPLNVIIYQ